MEASIKKLNLDDALLQELEQKAFSQGVSLLQMLYEEKYMDENTYYFTMASSYRMEYIPDLEHTYRSSFAQVQSDGEQADENGQSLDETNQWVVLSDMVCRFPLAWLKANSLLPLYNKNKELVLAVTTPKSLNCSQEVYFTLGEKVKQNIFINPKSLYAIINKAFDAQSQSSHDEFGDGILENSLEQEIGHDIQDDSISDLLDSDSDAPFIRFVNATLAQAIRSKVSDIHIEAYRDFSKIRFRLDGVLYEYKQLEKKHHAAVVSRLKVMAKLNIAEKRLPQDGRIVVLFAGREVSLRVSTLPTAFGERVVLRLLEKSEKVLSLQELGLTQSGLELLEQFLQRTHGIILVTGPTGSGKTTTLYAALQKIYSPHRNIMTIEDPIEYELDGIGQVQVNPKIGLTFAGGLRTLVRQDPDVILVGEIRDTETVAIAVQSALTGHLVLSTLHTNDAPSAITRLLDMGVESYLLSSVLRMVVAQRLVRTLCPSCKEKYIPNQEELQSLGQAKALYQGYLYKPKGCENCMQSGYKGRMAIYELMPISENIKKAIVGREDASYLRNLAMKENMQSLYQDGMVKVAEGLTSLQEAMRIVDSL